MTKKEIFYGCFVGVISTVAGTLVYDKVKDFPFLSTLKNLLNGFLNLIIGLLNYELKVWWILIIVLVVILLVAFYSRITGSLSEEDIIKRELPEFLYYQADMHGGFTWVWDWKFMPLTKSFEIRNLVPVCPVDSCDNNRLKAQGGSTYVPTPYYKCSSCNRVFNGVTSEETVNDYIVKKANGNRFTKTSSTLSPGIIEAVKKNH